MPFQSLILVHPFPPVYATFPPSIIVSPVIIGTPAVGDTLAVTNGTWNENGIPAYSYQWMKDSGGNSVFSNIPAAVASTYTLQELDGGCNVRCQVTNTDIYGSGTALSNTVGLVFIPPPALIAGTPELAFDGNTALALPFGAGGLATGFSSGSRIAELVRSYGAMIYDLLLYGGEATTDGRPFDENQPTPGHGLGRVTSGDFYLSTTGSDSNPGTLGEPFLTFNKAYRAASPGQTVVVLTGTYAMTDAGRGETYIDVDSSKSSATQDVTFVADGPIAFAATNFAFRPGVHHVTMRGSFAFRVVLFGYGGSYPTYVNNITLDGVSLYSYDMPGPRSITIKNSQIGPIHQGYGAAQTSKPVGQRLVIGDPIEDFFAHFPTGTTGQFIEPLIHNQSANTAQNILFDNCHMTGNNVKDAANMHGGAMFVTNTNGLTVQNCTFDNNVTFNIETWETGSLDNVIIQNNVFGYPVYTYDPSDVGGGTAGETTGSFGDVSLGTTGLSYSNWLIRYNSFSHGLRLSGTMTNVRVVGNILGNSSFSNATGVTFDHNAAFSGGSSFSGLDLGSSVPYVSYSGVDFRLNSGSSARSYVPWVGSDQQLATDINGVARSAPTNAGAYAT